MSRGHRLFSLRGGFTGCVWEDIAFISGLEWDSRSVNPVSSNRHPQLITTQVTTVAEIVREVRQISWSLILCLPSTINIDGFRAGDDSQYCSSKSPHEDGHLQVSKLVADTQSANSEMGVMLNVFVDSRRDRIGKWVVGTCPSQADSLQKTRSLSPKKVASLAHDNGPAYCGYPHLLNADDGVHGPKHFLPEQDAGDDEN
ncbi:hypothetical protein AAG570_000689 [Ranatra chinensis]|uniref:Transposase n=1 Tax=Ranatra chinensis TaxID=642074 RepID=A0ABD0ZL28_9HEMI